MKCPNDASYLGWGRPVSGSSGSTTYVIPWRSRVSIANTPDVTPALASFVYMASPSTAPAKTPTNVPAGKSVFATTPTPFTSPIRLSATRSPNSLASAGVASCLLDLATLRID